MGTLPTWLRQKVFFYIRRPRLFFFLSSWSDSNWLSQSLRRDKSLAKSLHFFSSFPPPSTSNFPWMGQGGQSLSSLPLDWVRRLKLNVWFKIVLAFPASCPFSFLWCSGKLGKLCRIGHNQIIYGELTAKELMHFILGCRGQGKVPSATCEKTPLLSLSPSVHCSLLALSLSPPSVLLIEIIAVTHFTRRRARGSRSLTWFSWEGWFGHSGSDRSSIDSPLGKGRGARRLHCAHGLLRKNKRGSWRQRPQWEQ